MDVSLLIRLIDQVSAPAKKVGEALNGIGDRAGELAQEFRSGFGQAIRQGFSVENIETATKNAEVAIGRARGRLMGAFGQMMALAAPVIQSGRFDQSIRGLDKVLDVTIERLAELRRFALDTSALVPIAARDLVELMSEAAQAGVPETELEAFSLYVARAAVAFDMAGAEIGERFAKLRNVYRLNQEGVEDLGDATNHLSNNMAAKASEITDFANRAAGAAAIFKLTATEISAVGTAMIAAGIVPETAARGFTALATRILSGGKDIERAFKAIGMNRKQFMKMLDEDAPAALQHLFTTMAKSEKGMQALIDLVGRDFADDFAKFLGNPELLAQAFELVADKAAYAGSATDEAAKQAAGAVKRWELFQNKMTRIAVVIGDQLLPPLIEALDSVGALVDRLAELAQANPEIASTAVTAIAALMGLSVASRLLAYGVALVRLPLIHLVGAFLKFDEAGRNVATGWRVLSAIGRMLGGTFSILRAVAMAVAGGIAGISAPVWAAVAAIAAAGLVVWKYWDSISSFASGFASVFIDLIGGAVSGAIGWIDGLIGSIGELVGIDGEQLKVFKAAIADAFDFSGLVDGARELLSGFWTWLGGVFTAERLGDAEKAGMHEAGRELAQSLIDGLLQYLADGWAAVEGWVSGKIAWLRESFTFEWPSWLRGGEDAAAAGAERRSGMIRDMAAMKNDDGGAASRFLAGLDRIGNEAAEAGSRYGAAASDQLDAEAASLGSKIGKAAAAEIARAAVKVNVGGSALAGSLDRAASGALHDGVD